MKALKTIRPSNKILATFALVIGALLLITLPAATLVRASPYFTYANSGEAAWVSATNNDPGTTFTIVALQQAQVLENPTMVATSSFDLYNLTGAHILLPSTQLSSPVCGTPAASTCAFYPYAYAVQPVLTGAYGYEISQILLLEHSSYALVGTGSHDTFNLQGGITDDTFSITAPGTSDTVTIQSGPGTAGGVTTYNINIGPQGSVAINGANANHYSIGSTTSVYNIIF